MSDSLVLVAATQWNSPWLPGSGGQQSSPAQVPWDCNNEETVLYWISTLGHRKAVYWSTLPVVLWKGPIFSSWSFTLRSSFVVFHTKACCGALWDAGWWTPALSCPLPPSRSLISPEKQLVDLSLTPILVATMLEIPLDCLALVTHRVDTCSLTLLYVFAYFKSFSLKIWFPIGLYLGADWDPPCWDTDRSWHTLNYWEPLEVKLAAWSCTNVWDTIKS